MYFEPLIGQLYYLYYNKNKQIDILMLVHPKEWRSMPSHLELQCAVKLLSDNTWEVLL